MNNLVSRRRVRDVRRLRGERPDSSLPRARRGRQNCNAPKSRNRHASTARPERGAPRVLAFARVPPRVAAARVRRRGRAAARGAASSRHAARARCHRARRRRARRLGRRRARRRRVRPRVRPRRRPRRRRARAARPRAREPSPPCAGDQSSCGGCTSEARGRCFGGWRTGSREDGARRRRRLGTTRVRRRRRRVPVRARGGKRN